MMLGPPDKSTPVWRVQIQSRSGVGVLWNCRLVDSQTVQFTASYNDAQLSRVEMEEAAEELLRLAAWLCEEGNWEKPIGEFEEEYFKVV